MLGFLDWFNVRKLDGKTMFTVRTPRELIESKEKLVGEKDQPQLIKSDISDESPHLLLIRVHDMN